MRVVLFSYATMICLQYLITATVTVQAEVANPLELVDRTFTVVSSVHNTSVYQCIFQYLLGLLGKTNKQNTMSKYAVAYISLFWPTGLTTERGPSRAASGSSQTNLQQSAEIVNNVFSSRYYIHKPTVCHRA